jgi:hypothetical protein
MSAAVVQAVLASDLRPLGLRMVAVVLAWHANDSTGHIWCSLGTIADEAGITRDRVKQVLRLLVAADVVEKVTKSAGGGRRSTTTYMFCPAWVGKQGTRDSSLPGKQGTRERALPGKQSAPEGGTSDHRGGNEGSPNIDERKASPSLSSKSAHPFNGGPVGPAVEAAPRKPNSQPQQPLTRVNSRPVTVEPWRRTDAGIQDKAESLGLGRWDGHERWGAYAGRVFKAAATHSAPATGSGRARP